MSSPDKSSADSAAHGKSTPEKLVYMANQIGTFFNSQDKDTAAAKIAEHIVKFWDPRMRTAILAHVDAGGTGLEPAARKAIETLRRR
jgi:formate dehydrogenase subunit delta